MPIVAFVGGAALGAAFQHLFDAIVKAPKTLWNFNKNLKKISNKLEKMKPLIDKITAQNVELDMAQNNEEFLKIFEEGNKLIADLSLDAEKKHFWKFPSNKVKLNRLDASLFDMMQKIGLQHYIVSIETMKIVREERQSSMSFVRGGFCEAPVSLGFEVGLRLAVAELREEVLRDRRVVVVTAPAGCGKTTLVAKLCEDEKIVERFKSNILFVKVSKTPNFMVVVEEIHQRYRRETPTFRDEDDAGNRLGILLRDMAQSSPVLLVLDDVWYEHHWFVDKFCFDTIPGYKILVTSRFEIKKFKPNYELKVLSDEDAMALFRYHAKLDDSSNIDEALVQKVVQHCKRCPLALKLIGSALCGHSRRTWHRELKKWNEGASSVLDFNNDLLFRLQSSVEVLGEKDAILKECFIDLGLFPEDRRISASTLIDIWTELYGISEEDAVDNLYFLNQMNMAQVLVTRSDVDEDDDYYSEHFVTLHDMIRELAIHNCKKDSGQVKRSILEFFGNSHSNSFNSLKAQSPNAGLLSISSDGLLLDESFDSGKTETKILVLNFLKNNQELPNFTPTMSQLKVLIATNYGSFLAELQKIQLLGHLTNLKKIRFERLSILSFDTIKLQNLQKLSFFMCNLGPAFRSLDISGVFPSLEELNIDYCSDLVKLPNDICNLKKMKKLSITHCHKLSSLPEEIGKLHSLNVLRLRSCTDLTELPSSICELSQLNFLDISDCFSLRNLPEDIGTLQTLTKLNMRECSRVNDLPSSILDLENLEEVVCDEEIKELWELYLPSGTNVGLTLAKEEFNLIFLG